MNILVVGDSCVDVFVYGSITRMSPEAPVPVIVPLYEKENAGMSGNVAANLNALGVNVKLITNKQKMRKVRYVDERYNHMVLRVDEGDECENIGTIPTDYSSYDAVIISDYCKGFLTKEDIVKISNLCECPVFLDTKKRLGPWSECVDFIKINHFEFENNSDVFERWPHLLEKVIITRGKHGCVYRDRTYETQEVPVKDVSGAGDTFISALVYSFVKSQDIHKSINFAQECTTVVVQKTGVATI